jgi:hypothetical protein
VKRIFPTMTAVILFAALLGLVLYGPQRPSRGTPALPAAKQLLTLRQEQIKQIEIVTPTFQLAVDKGGLKQSAVAAFRAQCCPLVAKQKVADHVADLTQYGLAKPQWLIKLNGQGPALEIGALNPAVQGYYARWSGSQTVYLVDSSLGTYLPRQKQDWLVK